MWHDVICQEDGRSPTYKPGSVDTLACIGRSFLSAFSHPNAPAAYPRLDVVRHRCRDGPSLAAYLALLRPGFTEPSPLPMTRWALTPPFHPYRDLRPGGLLSVALSVAHNSRCARPGVTWRSALWSPDFPRSTAPKRCTSRPSGRRLPASNIPCSSLGDPHKILASDARPMKSPPPDDAAVTAFSILVPFHSPR